jgi:hypothetical protein
VPIKISPKDLPTELRARIKGGNKLVRRAAYLAAQRARTRLVAKTPTDRGQARNAWKAYRTTNGAVVENSAPYIGILELGARPHPVSREGIDAIREWVRRNIRFTVQTKSGKFVQRKHGIDDPMLDEITWAIVNKIKKYGQPARYFVRAELPIMTKLFALAVDRELQKESQKRASRRSSSK